MDMNRETLNKYLDDPNLFKEQIKNCKTSKELYEFLLQIQNIKGYKIYVPNKWYIPVEDITIYEDGSIHCYFYMSGHRRYKSIRGLGKVAELVTCDKYDTFSLTYYN